MFKLTFLIRSIRFSVRPYTVARGQLHGLHEHRHIPVATRSQPGFTDGQRRNTVASGGQSQSDGHHKNIAPQRGPGGRQG